MTPLLRPWPPTSDAPDLSVFEPLVKNYYHAKFRASSLKNGWVIGLGTKEDIWAGSSRWRLRSKMSPSDYTVQTLELKLKVRSLDNFYFLAVEVGYCSSFGIQAYYIGLEAIGSWQKWEAELTVHLRTSREGTALITQLSMITQDFDFCPLMYQPWGDTKAPDNTIILSYLYQIPHVLM